MKPKRKKTHKVLGISQHVPDQPRASVISATVRTVPALPEQLPTHQLIGRLLNQTTSAPLAGFTVRAFDLEANTNPRDLGYDITDGKGRFVIILDKYDHGSGDETKTARTGHKLRLHILDPDGRQIFQTKIKAPADPQRILEIRAPMPEVSVSKTAVAGIAGGGNTICEQAGDVSAAQPHAVTPAQSMLLDNLLTAHKAELANGFETGLAPTSALISQTVENECKDCEAATSPLAYLTDLLDYALNHVENAGAPIDLGFLTSNFHQPFGDLSTSCESMSKDVRQVRIGIEVLRSYLKARSLPATGSQQQAALDADEKSYRLEAYTGLLNQIGGSYDEVRAIRSAKSAGREALADRLGIEIGNARPDHLDALFLDPAANSSTASSSSQPQPVTEQILEKLFGLADTRRDPLSEGARLGDTSEQITRWNLDGVEWGRNTDLDGAIFVRLRKPSTSGPLVELFRDRGRKALVASGSLAATAGHVRLTEQNNSGLSGDFKISYASDTSAIEIAAIPNVLAWRLQHLRTVWQEQDYPVDNAQERAPFIDPDLIGQGDLKNPVPGDQAFAIWQARRSFIDNQLADIKSLRESKAKALDGLNAILNKALSLSETDEVSAAILLEKLDESNQGNAITSWLDEHNLDRSAFLFLTRIANLAEIAAPVLDAEWDDVYSILVQATKRRQFVDWQEEERGGHTTLSPDYFRIRQINSSDSQIQLPPWRATESARRDWQDSLQSRIDQEQAVIAAWQATIAVVEQAALPSLRDALIMASDAPGADLEAKGRQLTDRLLIDTQASGGQKTTRIGQAMETLQGLFSGLRTGLLSDTHTTLQLVADNFDEESQWIGSYSTWRAAMFVYMYPQNILLPSLRKRQTPGFRALANNLRSTRRLTPERARAAAATYADYYKDVCKLSVDASCFVDARIEKGDEPRPLFFMFGQGSTTGAVYCSMFNPQDSTSFAQTFWEAIPGLTKAVRIIGAASYQINTDQRFIYLFAQIQDKAAQKLVFTRYDLGKQYWDEQPTTLELPKDQDRETTAFVAVVKQQTSASNPPHLAIRAPSGAIYDRSLNRDGSDWAEGDWKPLIGSMRGSQFSEICVMIENAPDEFYLLCRSDQGGFYRLFGPKDDGRWRNALPVPGNTRFKGAFGWPGAADVFVFYGSVDEITSYRAIKRSGDTPLGAQTKSTIQEFNNWLKDVAGVSLTQKIVKDNTQFSGMTALNFFTFSGGLTDELYFQHVRLYIDYLASEIETAEVWNEWKLADEAVRRFTVDHISLQQALTKILLGDASASGPPVSVPVNVLLMPTSTELSSQLSGLSGLKRIAAESSSVVSAGTKHVAIQRIEATGEKPGVFCHIFNRAGDSLTPSALTRIAPSVSGPFDITEHVPEMDLQARRTQIQSAVNNNKPPESNLTYVAEAYYFVPMQLALQLQSAGQYTCSLDWFRIVYDYSRPVDQRKIYYGLVEEESLPNIQQRAEDWLLDPLDPHAIAATRAKAYTRFTLQSIVDCFLDAADADFTRDTSESLARARMLYLTASQLLDAPEIKQLELQSGSLVQSVDSSPSERQLLADTRADQPRPRTMATVLARKTNLRAASHAALLGEPALSQAVLRIGTESRTFSALGASPALISVPASQFCIPPNPIPKALRLRVESNLFKLRNGRNIAGMQRQIEPYSAPTNMESGLPMIGAGGQLVLPGTITFQPTPYRFSALLERAKQLAQLAGQMEAAMLSAIEKSEAEAYNLLKARQDLHLTRAGVQLQDLRSREAQDGVKIADLQQQRTQIQVNHFDKLLNEDLSALELASLVLMGVSADLQLVAATLSFGAASITFDPSNSLSSAAQGVSSLAGAVSTTASILSTFASYERRKQDWQFQLTLSQQDLRIGAEQAKLAEDHVRVTGQERLIAAMQAENAEATLDFLTNKFTNRELYEWMSDTLERVYAYFLQQATAMAKLAENQLAFERQQTPPSFIQSDYWDAPTDGEPASADGRVPDRRGLTGSARLLQAISELDQYAFETNTRKLQLTKTFSLARLDPIEFQRLRETGVMTFATPMDIFDSDFPGHYLRLIRRVRTSVHRE